MVSRELIIRIFIVCFPPVSGSALSRKHFPEAHIEAAHGSVQSNIDYIRKSGKWADTEKSETCVEGTFEEWGTIPTQKGKREDMAELYDLVKSWVIAMRRSWLSITIIFYIWIK